MCFGTHPFFAPPSLLTTDALACCVSLVPALRVKLLNLLWMAHVDALIDCKDNGAGKDEQDRSSAVTITVTSVLELLIGAVRSESCDEDMRQRYVPLLSFLFASFIDKAITYFVHAAH